MIAEVSIFSIGVGESLSGPVAEAFRIIRASELSYEHHAMGTNLEGDWDEVMAVIKACRDRLLESSHRVSITIRIDDRKGLRDRMSKKVASADAKL